MVYVYCCAQCGCQFELRRSVAGRDEPAECSECNGAARRLFGSGVLIARAPGWWNEFTGADLDPEPDKRPEFGRKSWPTTGYARPQENRGRF